MNGAKAPVDKTDWRPLAGKSVVIWPDRDAPGWDYAESAARACVMAGSASVAILVPPTDKPAKWDAADAVDEGLRLRGIHRPGRAADRQGGGSLSAHLHARRTAR
jgi:DNA primase